MRNGWKVAMLAVSLIAASALPAFAATVAVNLSGKVSGLRDGSFSVAAPAFSKTSNIVGQRQTLSITTSDQTITIPTNTTGILLVLPSGNTNTVSIKGGSTSTGEIDLTGSSFAFLPASSSATLHASASATTTVIVTFF